MEFKEVTPEIRLAAVNQDVKRLLESPEFEKLGTISSTCQTAMAETAGNFWKIVLLSFISGVAVTVTAYEIQKWIVARSAKGTKTFRSF